MSIWATLVAFDADEDAGATRPYHGSHVMPSTTDADGPVLDLAAIPADVEAQRLGVDVLDDSVMDLYLPWLRVSLTTEAAGCPCPDCVRAIDCVLDRVQVEALWDVLGVWLDRQKTQTRKDGS